MLGLLLELMILEVFSNPNDSVFLCLMKMLKRIWPSSDC